jgi:hypothetical protein
MRRGTKLQGYQTVRTKENMIDLPPGHSFDFSGIAFKGKNPHLARHKRVTRIGPFLTLVFCKGLFEADELSELFFYLSGQIS